MIGNAVVNGNRFKHPVAEPEPTVLHGYGRLFQRRELAIEITEVFHEIVVDGNPYSANEKMGRVVTKFSYFRHSGLW